MTCEYNFQRFKEKAERELRKVARVEDEFKKLGKLVYEVWLEDKSDMERNKLMEQFHKKITKLKEAIKQ